MKMNFANKSILACSAFVVFKWTWSFREVGMDMCMRVSSMTLYPSLRAWTMWVIVGFVVAFRNSLSSSNKTFNSAFLAPIFSSFEIMSFSSFNKAAPLLPPPKAQYHVQRVLLHDVVEGDAVPVFYFLPQSWSL